MLIKTFENMKNKTENIANVKKLRTFEVRVIHSSLDANTETKKKRKPTVESTAVIHRHRLCVARRDFLPFNNLKSFIMRATNDESAIGTIPAISANEVIERLIMSDDLTNMRQNLRAMADAYLLSEDDTRFRQEVYSTYQDLDRILILAFQAIVRKERRVV